MSDAFALLTGGSVRFDKRFKRDFDAFSQKPSHASSEASQPPEQDASPDMASEFDPGCPVVVTTERDDAVRKYYRIKVKGDNVPSPLTSWRSLLAASFQVPQGLITRCIKEGYSQPTPIQRQSIPALLSERDVLASAPTGSGKTLAFLLPIVAALRAQRDAGVDWPNDLKAVILSPTNELAAQQARTLKLILPGSGLRGSLLTKSTAAGTDWKKVDILLANPLRLLSLIESKKISLEAVRWLIIDEADKLFELNFVEQLDGIIAACTNQNITRALFSATLPERVEELARSILQQPLRITCGVRNTAASTVTQKLVFVGQETGKLSSLRQFIRDGLLRPPCLIFVASKDRAKALHREMKFDGLSSVDCIHSDQPLASRNKAVENFRSGKMGFLIATDLISRGIDFIGVSSVVNYDFPPSSSDYIHRVGRTGRAGNSGYAVTFFTEDDSGQLRSIANLIKESGGEVEEWMLSMKKAPRDAKRKRLPSDVRPVAKKFKTYGKEGGKGKGGGKEGGKGCKEESKNFKGKERKVGSKEKVSKQT
jgi:ATP-dependent RNA helicase DDX52/ROK1